VLVVSKVANFSIDLPEASVAIQVSGTFGSRQEEAQRLGRILRPKADGRQAHFFTIVARDTNDQQFAANRQRFLAEQGYTYEIVDAEAILHAAADSSVAPAALDGPVGGLSTPDVRPTPLPELLPPPPGGSPPDGT
jgi:DNA excision repair protein ERCC-3